MAQAGVRETGRPARSTPNDPPKLGIIRHNRQWEETA